jgi:hypothetical protein
VQLEEDKKHEFNTFLQMRCLKFRDVHLTQRQTCGCKDQWRTEAGGGGGVQTPFSEIPKFDRVEPDCILSGKCSVLLFQHPN